MRRASSSGFCWSRSSRGDLRARRNARPSPYSPRSAISSTTGSGTIQRIGSARPDARADRARRRSRPAASRSARPGDRGTEPLQRRVDRGVVGSRPLGDGDRGQLEHALGAAPALESGGHIGAHDEGQIAPWLLILQATQAYGRRRTGPPADLEVGDRERGRTPRRRGGPSRAARSGPGSGSITLCGASPVGTSSTSSRPSSTAASWASSRWPRCGGLKAPPRTPTAATHPRIWPSPRRTYLVEVSSRSPIGPRACSFWVELPISAPIPNSKPSVKRVEALT